MSGYLAVVPARGGSKGLPNKNIRLVQGLSLVARAVMLARGARSIERVIVSTDSPAIAEAALAAGGEVPFLRPPELARDDTPMVAVLEHVLAEVGHAWRGLVLLQPTSPMRRLGDIEAAIKRYEEECDRADPVACVHTVSRLPNAVGPGRWQRIDRRGRLVPVGQEGESHLCYRNGAAVVLDPARLTALNLREGRVVGHVIEEPLLTIDSLEDLWRIEHCDRVLEPAM